jgi:hypothetical protein
MRRYKSLDPAEVSILVDYAIAINQYGPMTAATVRFYAERSKSPEQMASYNNRQNAEVD